MVRTQVYLPKDYVQEITLLAKKHGKSKAETIRLLIEKGLDEERKSTVEVE